MDCLDEKLLTYLINLENSIFIKELELLILKDEQFNRMKVNKIKPEILRVLKDRYDNFGVDDEFKKILLDSLPTNQKQVNNNNLREYRKVVKNFNRKVFF